MATDFEIVPNADLEPVTNEDKDFFDTFEASIMNNTNVESMPRGQHMFDYVGAMISFFLASMSAYLSPLKTDKTLFEADSPRSLHAPSTQPSRALHATKQFYDTYDTTLLGTTVTECATAKYLDDIATTTMWTSTTVADYLGVVIGLLIGFMMTIVNAFLYPINSAKRMAIDVLILLAFLPTTRAHGLSGVCRTLDTTDFVVGPTYMTYVCGSTHLAPLDEYVGVKRGIDEIMLDVKRMWRNSKM